MNDDDTTPREGGGGRSDDQAFLEAIVENIPDMIFVKDARELRFVRFNRAGEELLGYARGDLLGKNDYDFFPKEEADFFTSKDRRVLDEAAHEDIPEEPIHTRFRGTRWLHTKKVPILDPGTGEPRFLLGISEDITDRKLAQAAAERARMDAEAANQAKSDFLGVMSHEIRTPLHGILGMASLLGDTALDREQREMVDILQQSGQRLLKIVNDILDITRIESGRLEILPEPIAFDAVLGDALDLFRARADARNLLLRFHPSGCPWPVLGDAGRIQQVITNLLSNAVRYTDAGSVTLAAAVTEAAGVATFHVEVVDTGPGIAPEDLGRIFEPFVQGAGARHDETGGTGLGLPIARQLVGLMGGALEVSSELGRGSTFRFTLRLPTALLDREEPATRPPRDPSAGGAPGWARNVLLAEDDPSAQHVGAFLLRRLGCEVVLASTGREAVDLALSRGFDLVLMDCNLPEVSGWEATRLIRDGQGPGARTPILALTANAMQGTRETCLAAGMDGYLSKPVTLEGLRRALDEWGARNPAAGSR